MLSEWNGKPHSTRVAEGQYAAAMKALAETVKERDNAEAEVARLRRVEEAARKVHFWNDSAEPYADLAFDDAMAELGKALEGGGVKIEELKKRLTEWTLEQRITVPVRRNDLAKLIAVAEAAERVNRECDELHMELAETLAALEGEC